MQSFSLDASPAWNTRSRHDESPEIIELSGMPRSIAPSRSTSNYSLLKAEDDGEHLLEQPKFAISAEETEVSGLADAQPSSTRANRERRRRLQGWRFGVSVAVGTTFMVMVVNLALMVTAVVKFHDTIMSGIGTVYHGDCTIVNNWSTAIHILINGLSSLMLSASNYTMQCLCSPTRKEIDSAHSKGDWLDIGLPSIRNIRGRISPRRIAFWWILALSSAPVHLLYNSSAFKSIDANLYQMLVVNDRFLDGRSFSRQNPHLRNIQAFFADNYKNRSAVQKMSNAECMTAYGTFFVSGRNHVLLITNHTGPSDNDTFFHTEKELPWNDLQYLSYNWICDDYGMLICDVPSFRSQHADDWEVGGVKIDYCLSQLEPAHCKLQFSIPILAVVIAMNFCKCASMLWTVFRQRSSTLVTIGDAIASYLDSPDPLTQRRCLTSKDEVTKGPLLWQSEGTESPNTNPPAIAYQTSTRRRWFAAASSRRWIITMALCFCALIVATAMLASGVTTLSTNYKGANPLNMGFGAVDSRALIYYGLPKTLVGAVLVANLPQAIVSLLYLAYNGLLTSMLLSNEWSRYYLRPKSIRTTTPHGKQRSTYWLHLPYMYSVPLLVASAVLHWLISESIFLARIDMYTNGEPKESLSQVGYSCLPMLLVIVLGGCMLTAALALGCRRFASTMPVAGSCSVAIAAACHRPKDDVDAAYLPVSWGEVENEDPTDDVHHCCFTSHATQELVPGRMYAGQQHQSNIAKKRA